METTKAVCIADKGTRVAEGHCHSLCTKNDLSLTRAIVKTYEVLLRGNNDLGVKPFMKFGNILQG